MERREHEVAGHRGPESNLGSLLVADLAHEEHVGVGAEHGAQAARERQPRSRVDLDLVEAGRPVLDGVLDRRQLAVGRVQHLEAGVQGRRLARPGRPDHDDRPERLVDRVLEGGTAAWPQAEGVERIGSLSLREDAQRHLLSVRGREHGHAYVDHLRAALDRDAAVLRVRGARRCRGRP